MAQDARVQRILLEHVRNLEAVSASQASKLAKLEAWVRTFVLI